MSRSSMTKMESLWKIKSHGALKYYDENEELRNGKWKGYYKTGELKEISSWKNGTREGKWREYYKNGELKVIGSFKDDKIDGERRKYYQNGKLKRLVYTKMTRDKVSGSITGRLEN